MKFSLTSGSKLVKSIIKILKEPIVISILLSSVFTVLVMRHNASTAFTPASDPSIYKLSVLLKAGFWAVFTIIIYALLAFYRQLRSGDIFFKRWLIYASVYFFILFIVLLLVYPGHWVWDEFNILEVVKTYTPYSWQNYFTNIYYTFCLFIFPSAISIILIQVTLISIIVGYVTAVARSLINNRFVPAILILLFCLPPILINNLYPLRITLYSYAEVALFAYLLNSYVKNKLRLTPHAMMFLFFLIGILSFWRSEGIYYLALIPILMVYGGIIDRDNWGEFKTHAVLMPGYVILAILGLITYLSNDPRYAITTMINPLSIMVHDPLRGSQTKEKLADMEKTLNMDILRQYPSYTEIPSYWKDVLRPDYANNLKSFRSDYLYIIAHNPDYFLKARAKTFLATNGLTKEYPPVLPVGLLGRDDELTANEQVVARRFENTNILTTPINPSLKQTVTSFLLGINEKDRLTIFGHLFWNLFLPIALLAAILIHSIVKRRFFWTTASLLILLRVPIIFITAPASYFMYYLPVYISGFTLAALYLFMYRLPIFDHPRKRHVRGRN